MIDKPIRTELSEFGEFKLIDHLTKPIKLNHKSTVKGVGDDAAVIDAGKKYMLLTNDLLVEGIHFDLTYTPIKHLGYKSVAVNLSDIAAMNGIPKHLVVSIAVSNRFSVEALEELYAGIYLACEKFKVDVIGGDTTSSTSGLMISITVMGEVDKDKVTYRDTAKVNDLVCTTGNLGGAYMGLLLLEREKAVFEEDPNMQPDLEGHDYIIGRQLKPEPRLDIVDKLSKAGILPNAMIDISDGLGSDIKHICNQSKLGCRIYEDKLPIDPTTINMAHEFKMGPWTAVLNGGEDYELLFTIRQNDFEKIKLIPEVSVIGHMTEENEGIFLVTTSDSLVEIKAQGWDGIRKGHSEGEEM